MAKSLLDLAFDYLSQSNEQVAFKDLWAYVCEQAGLDEETANKKISPFYTNLKMDGRFVTLGENKWDLRTRHTFDKTHIDMKDVYSEVEISDDDVEEDEDEKEYNKVLEGDSSEENENNERDEEENEDEEKREEEDL